MSPIDHYFHFISLTRVKHVGNLEDQMIGNFFWPMTCLSERKHHSGNLPLREQMAPNCFKGSSSTLQRAVLPTLGEHQYRLIHILFLLSPSSAVLLLGIMEIYVLTTKVLAIIIFIALGSSFSLPENSCYSSFYQ